MRFGKHSNPYAVRMVNAWKREARIAFLFFFLQTWVNFPCSLLTDRSGHCTMKMPSATHHVAQGEFTLRRLMYVS